MEECHPIIRGLSCASHKSTFRTNFLYENRQLPGPREESKCFETRTTAADVSRSVDVECPSRMRCKHTRLLSGPVARRGNMLTTEQFTQGVNWMMAEQVTRLGSQGDNSLLQGWLRNTFPLSPQLQFETCCYWHFWKKVRAWILRPSEKCFLSKESNTLGKRQRKVFLL